MPNPYSSDLRLKVLEAIEKNGMKHTEACEHFNISRSTINRWLKHKAETGTVNPKPHPHPGHSHAITDWDSFRAFAQEHQDKTQAEMAELWPSPISRRTISRALKKIGFTRKKKNYG